MRRKDAIPPFPAKDSSFYPLRTKPTGLCCWVWGHTQEDRRADERQPLHVTCQKSHAPTDTECLPLSSLSAVPGLANRTQLCLMHLNNTTTLSSLGTAWPSQPAGQNSSGSDSGSNKAMLLLKGAAAAETSLVSVLGTNNSVFWGKKQNDQKHSRQFIF